MSEGTIIGIDLAKRVFQLHGARHDGSVAHVLDGGVDVERIARDGAMHESW